MNILIKQTTFLLTLVLAVMVATPGLAQVAGEWNGSMQTPQGNVPVTYSFQESGGLLSGTTTGPDGIPLAIENGRVDGSEIRFDVTVQMQGRPATMSYQGDRRGDRMDLTVEMGGMQYPVSLSRDEDE